MAFLWICPLVLSHKPHHFGDGSCGYKVLTNCAANFTLNGQTQQATKRGTHAGLFIDLASITTGSIVSIQVTPQGTDAEHYWPVSGEIRIGKPCVVTSNPMAAFNVVTLGINKDGLSILYVFLSRLRDCTERVKGLLQSLPTTHPDAEATRQSWSPLWQNPLPSRGHLHYVTTTRPESSDLAFSKADIIPQGENLVFEVCGHGSAGVIVPRLLSVYWPQWVTRKISTDTPDSGTWPRAEPTSFLIFYHPNTGQNKNWGYYLGSYPESFDYLYYIHWSNHNYTSDPLVDAHKGVTYQIGRSRTQSVLIVPCLNSNENETGRFNDGDFIVESLEEIQAQMFRRQGFFLCQPTIGRTALAGFSAGTQLVANTIGSTRGHPVSSRVIKELYILDPNIDNPNVLAERITTCDSFLSIGSATDRVDKVARIYTQIGSPAARARLQQFLGQGAPSLAGAADKVRIVDSIDSLRTVGILPHAAWPSLDVDGTTIGIGRTGREVHQLIPATMITDALARSLFAKA